MPVSAGKDKIYTKDEKDFFSFGGSIVYCLSAGARVFGGNLEGKVAWKDKVQVQAGLTAQNSRFKEARTWSDEGDVPETRKMFRTPDFYGYLSAS